MDNTPSHRGEKALEAHGGYFIRLESFSGLDLVSLSRQALMLDGQGDDQVG